MVKKMAVMGLRHQRGRLAGHIEVLKRSTRKNQAKLECLQARINADAEKIQTLEAQIEVLGSAAQYAFGTELAQPVPRRTVPKNHLAGWGAVRRELLRQLKLANGTPLCTVQIAHLVNKGLALNLSQDDLARLRVHVRYALKSLYSRNAVVRFSAATQPGDFSTWLLADSPA